MEKLPLYKLTIKEDEEAIQEVNAVALVDMPAIGENFFAFNKHLFVEPGESETQDEFIPRCIEYMINEGKDNEQAAAICYSIWEEKFGGEGSGCQGDNCGRPKGSGDEGLVGRDIVNVVNDIESGNAPTVSKLIELDKKNPVAASIIEDIIYNNTGSYKELDEKGKKIFDEMTNKKDYELYRVDSRYNINNLNVDDDLDFEKAPTFVASDINYVKNLSKSRGDNNPSIIVFEEGTKSIKHRPKFENGSHEVIRGTYKVKKIEGDKIYVEQVKKQNMNLNFINSYTDYPKAARENAKIALRWAEENGWGSCGTPVGKARANQLAKGEPISRDTIARMAAFERHRQNSQKELGDGCGRLMWLAWGGDAGIEWAQRKLAQIDREQKMKFSVVNEDDRIIVGPAMIPDLPIYRKDETGEYYVFFDKKTIETIALKFYAKGFQQNANEMHAKAVDGITFFQSWIADESKGIPKMKQFENLPDGTWFLGAKVENDETWAKVKDGTFKGFSVEGMFDMTEIKMRKSADEIIAKLRELLADV